MWGGCVGRCPTWRSWPTSISRRSRRGSATTRRRGRPRSPRRGGDVDPEARDNRYLNSLLLDYSTHAKGALDPAGRLRDHLVTLDEEHTLLLGHAFLALGALRVPATFFVLERLRPAP